MEVSEVLRNVKKATTSNKNRKYRRNRAKCEAYFKRRQRMKNNPARTGRKREI